MTESSIYTVECPTEQAIVRALLYFEIFSYPLTADEVFRFSNCRGIAPETVFNKLQNLVEQGIVYSKDAFFLTRDNPDWVARRQVCNHRADAFLPLATRTARFIGSFPFIRSVFVSGSLSKHCMHADSDVDFFLITEPGRLWLARTLLVVFKKVFLFNSHKYFCVNYFIDTEHLEIAEKNLFTATETVTLLPMYGKEWYHAFCSANPWAWEQYPNAGFRPAENIKKHNAGLAKRSLEWLLGGKTGQWLDEKAMRLTLAFWKKKFSHLEHDHFNLALKSRRYVSKHHPLNFQEKVLKTFSARVKEMNIRPLDPNR
ncbi:MAG: nucleotidyltransferase domain-containing protein [Lewinellaceae bacterium]|nr:nucleotidyltransferase domain-containing protein [Lewinellaceae bacterium]